LEKEQKASDVAVLIVHMADWAAVGGDRAMDKLIKLPLQGLEEEVPPF
jgi:hypothetical protein